MTVSRRLPVLFLLALLGVLTMVGLVVVAVLGPVPAGVYAALVVALLALGVRRFRPRPREDHRGCSCCSGEPFRGVEVV